MAVVKFRAEFEPVVLQPEQRLLDALLARQLGVKMLCGGRGLCATCHVYVTRNAHQLSPQTERERRTLVRINSFQPNSRLACQSRVLGDEVEIELPQGLYIQSYAELESFIGKRAPAPILHPVSGLVLIQANKIITRTALMQLKGEDFDFSQLTTGQP